MAGISTKVLGLCILVCISLASCQADFVVPSTTSAPEEKSTEIIPTETSEPTGLPEPTATPFADEFWVDPSVSLGEISRYVLGANHGPWSELGAGNIEPAKESGITFLRWPGGHWGDINELRPNLIDNFIPMARNLVNAEPSIAVRLPGSTPGQAAQLVQYTNIDMKYGVRYWSIGNEPNLFDGEFSGWTAERYAKEWREFALAMKAVDPTILLYGPDINQFVGDAAGNPQEGTGREYLVEFLKVNGDLVDVVTVHRYPFPLKFNCASCPGVTKEDLRDNTPEWDRILPNLHQLIIDTIGTDKPVGITEFNSDYTNIVGSDTSPDSFYQSIWLADILGRLIRQRPEILTYWMLKSNTAGHGLMTSYDIRPSYYVYQIYQKFGDQLLSASSPEKYVSLFAAKRSDGTLTLIFVNRGESSVTKPLNLSEGDNFKLIENRILDVSNNFEELPLIEFKNGSSIVLPAESVTLWVFEP